MKITRTSILLLAIPLALGILGGCGSTQEVPVADAPIDPKAAAQAGQAGAANDLASQQARASAQEKGKAAVAAEQAKAGQ